jgi:hypothetical protein
LVNFPVSENFSGNHTSSTIPVPQPNCFNTGAATAATTAPCRIGQDDFVDCSLCLEFACCRSAACCLSQTPANCQL